MLDEVVIFVKLIHQEMRHFDMVKFKKNSVFVQKFEGDIELSWVDRLLESLSDQSNEVIFQKFPLKSEY